MGCHFPPFPLTLLSDATAKATDGGEEREGEIERERTESSKEKYEKGEKNNIKL